MSINLPSYIKNFSSEELKARVHEAWTELSNCSLCGWDCCVNRISGKIGVCQSGIDAIVSSYGAHMGEENPLRGWRGSGTIFFAGCNLFCQFCQNADISQTGKGSKVSPEQLADIMLKLQNQGCHNINFVSPSHYIYPILAAVQIAADKGLKIPLVYNTGGYDSLKGLTLLDGIIDIYMPDMKYADSDFGKRYSKAPHYPSKNQEAVKEMHRQVGDLVMDENQIAVRGLLIRHLVMPDRIAGTAEIVRFIAEEISTNSYLNIMQQYHPTYKSNQYPEIDRRITYQEYQEAIEIAHKAGLYRLD